MARRWGFDRKPKIVLSGWHVAALRSKALMARLLCGDVSVDALAKNLGTSVAMIERHYSHLTPRLAARELE